MAAHICVRCNKTLASRQSLWNHRQRCKDSKDELHATLGDGLVVKSSSRSAPSESDEPIDKEKIIEDILNEVEQRVMEDTRAQNGRRWI